MGAGCRGTAGALTDSRLTRGSEAASTGGPNGWLTHLAVLNLKKQASRHETRRTEERMYQDRVRR